MVMIPMSSRSSSDFIPRVFNRQSFYFVCFRHTSSRARVCCYPRTISLSRRWVWVFSLPRTVFLNALILCICVTNLLITWWMRDETIPRCNEWVPRRFFTTIFWIKQRSVTPVSVECPSWSHEYLFMFSFVQVNHTFCTSLIHIMSGNSYTLFSCNLTP